ncbi:MAG: hypothetical protein V1754_03645 [Pseudomonadota bacterium]
MKGFGLFFLAIAIAGCGGQGSYALHWTLGCEETEEAVCRVESVRDCTEVGIDTIEVVATSADVSIDSLFPCYSEADGPIGRGPGLPAGKAVLLVRGVSPGGQAITDSKSVSVQILETGLTAIDIDLPLPKECQDGVDNDRDGLVDLLDPGCVDREDSSEEKM